jgi:hypothetical protein
VERPAGLDRVEQVGVGSVELKSGAGLASAGLTGDQDGPVVAAESRQLCGRR